MTSPVIALTTELVNRRSITPEDAGCQPLLARRLSKLGFSIEHMDFEDTRNLWATRGDQGPVLCFAGHTDVVPTGPLHNWQTDPFEATSKDGYLYGRGVADMKGGLAAMVIAAEQFVAANPQHKGTIAFLITSDEEGPFINGTTRVVDTLIARAQAIDWCVVGEPSSTERIGDVIKNGRRGSLSGDLTVFGKQGHVAYPHLASNPLHSLAPALSELVTMEWDKGNDFFPPTSFQVSNLQAGAGAHNVIPGELHLSFNFRFSTEVTEHTLRERVHRVLDDHGVDYSLDWKLNGQPFLTPKGPLLEACISSIETCTGKRPALSTSGGTSDGRFIARMGAQVVELGLVNESIHQANEKARIEDIEQLVGIYYHLLEQLLT